MAAMVVVVVQWHAVHFGGQHGGCGMMVDSTTNMVVDSTSGVVVGVLFGVSERWLWL